MQRSRFTLLCLGYQVGKPVKAANMNASDTSGSLNIWQPGTGL